ncbi:SMI1/KNR4 family protein [Protofrankia symbiont of Coriaria ruscifolia]|uniref:SMI1/KNR4 family protein n=1 Tax=Protofrankia symbiont of Coriaria ruscifolia TaxID=1306542 RepID=UPI0010416640|nr:SMI1/KNR4 family protein [Protofrankia symbiont of Coriaria ruscifolia]
MTYPGPTIPPGAHLALSIVHPGSPTLRIRYRDGVLVTPQGYPDWALCARAMVDLPHPEPGLTLDEVRVVDVLAANVAMARAAAGPDGDRLWLAGGGPAEDAALATPPGWCWAHLGPHGRPGRQLALVPIELHGSYRHAGGVRALPTTGRGLRLDAEPAPVGHGPAEPVPDDVLDVLERLFGWPLPPRYRRFLAETNGAGPAAPGVLPGYGFVADQPLFGVARTDQHQDVSYAAEWVRDRLTLDFLPIGYVQGGLFAVKISGGDVDSIWYWDDDDPRDRNAFGADYICAHLLHRCADDIDDLWASLARPARPLLRIAAEWAAAGRVTQVCDEAVGAGLPARMKAPWQPRTPSRPDSLTALFEAR